MKCGNPYCADDADPDLPRAYCSRECAIERDNEDGVAPLPDLPEWKDQRILYVLEEYGELNARMIRALADVGNFCLYRGLTQLIEAGAIDYRREGREVIYEYVRHVDVGEVSVLTGRDDPFAPDAPGELPAGISAEPRSVRGGAD